MGTVTPGRDAEFYGITVTCTDGASVHSFVCRNAQEAAGTVRARGADWRILCVATPETIYADLKGRRPTNAESGGDGHLIRFPEPHILGRADAFDLLHPTLAPRSRYTRKPRRTE